MSGLVHECVFENLIRNFFLMIRFVNIKKNWTKSTWKNECEWIGENKKTAANEKPRLIITQEKKRIACEINQF
jgi:hypothetical protein